VPREAELANGFTWLRDLPELDDRYPNVRAILELWFASYWGVGRTHVLGWGDAAEAARILEASKHAYEARGISVARAPQVLHSGRPGAAALRLPAWWRSDVHAR